MFKSQADYFQKNEKYADLASQLGSSIAAMSQTKSFVEFPQLSILVLHTPSPPLESLWSLIMQDAATPHAPLLNAT
jgi:hypothetical protein